MKKSSEERIYKNLANHSNKVKILSEADDDLVSEFESFVEIFLKIFGGTPIFISEICILKDSSKLSNVLRAF